jgi:hypothetical protein
VSSPVNILLDVWTSVGCLYKQCFVFCVSLFVNSILYVVMFFLGPFERILTKKLAFTSQLSRKVARGRLILSEVPAVPWPNRPWA